MPTEAKTRLVGRSIRLNAHDGERPVRGELPAAVIRWALSNPVQVSAPTLALPPVLDLSDWRHPEVGWGVIVQEGASLGKPLAALMAARKASVFHFRPNWTHSFRCLIDTKSKLHVDMTGAPRGMAPGSLPHYLLIAASPKAVPWEVQYILSANRCVGRIDLEPDGLKNYVDALLDDFGGKDAADPRHTVIWSVDVTDRAAAEPAIDAEPDDIDITTLMRQAIAEPVHQRLAGDTDRCVHMIPNGAAGADDAARSATRDALLEALATYRPGLVVTTSHGRTGPLHDLGTLRAHLGLPVDIDGLPLTPKELTMPWKPAGAVWYAHACCSAGSQAPSLFAPLFSDTPLGDQLVALGQTGPMTAPLPRYLLGCERPARAFIGHVEPTFDWTLRDPDTGQVVTWPLVDALYPNIFRDPVGYAFRDWYPKIGAMYMAYSHALRRLDRLQATPDELLTLQLAMADIQSTVILGDPAALLPAV